jgi:RNA 3'-phosphate cyclase
MELSIGESLNEFNQPMLRIDGTHGEGGGQIVRTALALSVLTGRPFVLTDIRAGRSQAGLKAQHLTAIKAWREICGAVTNEVHTGSTFLKFTPGPVQPGSYTIDIGTAGSIALLLQAMLLPLSFAPKATTLHIQGGTSGKWQAPVEYYQLVLFPYLERIVSLGLQRIRLGYYPKGGGKIRLTIRPRFQHWHELSALPPFDITTPGKIREVRGISHAARFLEKARVAERQAMAAREVLQTLDCPLNLETEYGETLSPGSGITLCAIMENKKAAAFPIRIGAGALGERGRPAEDVGKDAAQQLKKTIASGATVDKHLSDQLIPFLALLPGSKMRAAYLSRHLLSNIYVVEQFLPVKFQTKGNLVTVEAS